MSLPGRDLLAQIKDESPKTAAFLENYLIPQIQAVARNAGVSATGNLATPAPPESISVTPIGNEHLQVVVNHTAKISKGIQYITHIATNPQFSDAIIHDHGCSRCPPPIFVPTKTAGGDNHTFYVATVTQMPGSKPSVTYYGGETPTPITLTGTTQADIQPGTGSGTAKNGGQTLVGLGKAQVRLGSK